MTYKTIFSGRLEFGSPRSYEKVTKMYEHRVENFYRAEILLKGEEIFDEESHSLNVPRFITQASDKTWRNTINLLEYVAQFAVAGDLSAWMTDDGKVIKHKVVEPRSDKAAVQAFITGRKLVKEVGRETEAKKALSQAIEKFERHAKAYERRGFVNFQLENYADALYDYNKSIDINPGNPDAFLGRAFIYPPERTKQSHRRSGYGYQEIHSAATCLLESSSPEGRIAPQTRGLQSGCAGIQTFHNTQIHLN